MSRRSAAVAVVALSVIAAPAGAVWAQAAPAGGAQASATAAAAAPAALTHEQAAPFLGNWTLTTQSAMGPATFALSLTEKDSKVTGTISSDQIAETPITDITRNADGSLLLRYMFDYQGSGVDAEVTLMPPTDGTMKVSFAFAQGQFTMDGTGTKAVK